MIHFVDGHSDLDTVNYMAKSLSTECLEKALNHTGLVQKEVQYTTQSGRETYQTSTSTCYTVQHY